MKVGKVWLRGLLVLAFLAFLTSGTTHAQNSYPDLSMWEGRLFSLVETRIGLDFNGTNVISSSSILKKLLYIPEGDLDEQTFVNGGPVLHGLLYVLEGKKYRFDRFIELQYLGGTALDFYGNSFAYPSMFADAIDPVWEVGDRTVFRLKGKMRGKSLSSATFVTIGGIFNEFPLDGQFFLTENNFESIRAGGLSYVGALLPELIARPIIRCLPEAPGPLPPP